MFYDYMWQKFSISGNVLDYIVFKELEDDITDLDDEKKSENVIMI